MTADYIFAPVRHVSRRPYHGVVYNLETSDNTYLMSNAITHNCTHVSPNLPEYGGRFHASEEFEILDEVLKRVDPPLSTSGHLSGPYTLSKLRDTTILRIDSSPAERHYALVDPESREIRIMHDHDQVETNSFARPS